MALPTSATARVSSPYTCKPHGEACCTPLTAHSVQGCQESHITIMATSFHVVQDHGKTSVTASLGMITLWDVEGGLPQIDKYLYSRDNHVVAGTLCAVQWVVGCDYMLFMTHTQAATATSLSRLPTKLCDLSLLVYMSALTARVTLECLHAASWSASMCCPENTTYCM